MIWSCTETEILNTTTQDKNIIPVLSQKWDIAKSDKTHREVTLPFCTGSSWSTSERATPAPSCTSHPLPLGMPASLPDREGFPWRRLLSPLCVGHWGREKVSDLIFLPNFTNVSLGLSDSPLSFCINPRSHLQLRGKHLLSKCQQISFELYCPGKTKVNPL